MTRLALTINLVIVAALAGCDPAANVGTGHPDGATSDGAATDAAPGSDAHVDGGTSTDGGSCSCGPASCGTRICGRSACGYPCGGCASGDFCFVGTQCQTGVGPGTACIDAFNERVWEGDRGLRTCPTDATLVQACTCSGGGAQGWISCDTTCIQACSMVPPHAIQCGAASCDSTSQVCCTSSANTSSQACAAAPCTVGNYTRACDGPEDCGSGVCCGGDFPWTASCAPGATSCGALNQFCHSGANCPTAAHNCCPLAGTDVRACSASATTGCN